MNPPDYFYRIIESNFNTDSYRQRKVLQTTSKSLGMTKSIFKECVTKEIKNKKELKKLTKLWCRKLGNTKGFKHNGQVAIKKDKSANKR